jgi:hypothetical protein
MTGASYLERLGGSEPRLAKRQAFDILQRVFLSIPAENMIPYFKAVIGKAEIAKLKAKKNEWKYQDGR